MNTKSTKFCAILACASVVNAGYANPDFLSPDHTFGLPPALEEDGDLYASNILFTRLVQTQTELIHHIATPRQRAVAQTRAVAYFKKLKPEKKAELKKKKIRYIAVDTEKNAETTPKAKKVIMIWDTVSESLVGKNCYDLPAPPPVGTTAKFETYAAEYVGSGSDNGGG